MADAVAPIVNDEENVEIRLDLINELPSYTDFHTESHQKPPNYDDMPSPPPYKPINVPSDSLETGLLPAYMDSVRHPSRKSSKHYIGWRATLREFSIISWSLAATGIFFLGFTKAAYDELSGGFNTTLLTGDCEAMKNYRILVHALLAVLSATMLSIAGYTAHVCTAPTRNEIHAAHRKRRSLDVGIVSLRNLFHISWWRRVGALAAITCGIFIPILYNSTFYTTFVSIDHTIGLVSEGFLNDHSRFHHQPDMSAPSLVDWNSNRRMMQSDYEAISGASNMWKNITTEECVNLYAKNFVGSYQNLLAVTTTPRRQKQKGIIGFHRQEIGPLQTLTHKWFCRGENCDPVNIDTDNWTLGRDSTPVVYCLTEPIDMARKCRIEASRPLLAVATSLTILMSIVMSTLLLFQRKVLIATHGDAISSFMDVPDQYTTGMCTLSHKKLSRIWEGVFPYPRHWSDKSQFLWEIPSKARWQTFHWVACLLILGGLLEYFMVCFTTEASPAILFRRGFGKINPESVADFLLNTGDRKGAIQSLPSHLIIAALPQAVVGIIWMLSFYPLLSIMSANRETASYAHTRQGLRVSRAPMGAQTATKYLSTPYHIAFWLFTELSLLTFLLTQSIFVGRVDFLDRNFQLKHAYHAVHWNSPAIIIIFLIVVPPLMLAPTVLGYCIVDDGPPIAGTSSAVLAAITQPAPDASEEDVIAPSLWAVRWGVHECDRGGIGHLGFSMKRVNSVSESNRLYF